VALSGCGGGGQKGSTASIPSSASSSSTPVQAPATTTAKPGGSPTKLGQKPSIPKPSGPPPNNLVVRDLVKGTGQTAKKGDTVSVQYVGVSYSTGKQFDASWDRGQPFQFELGAGNVIPGWDKGVVGMKVGGRRQLIVPANLAYGAQGQPPTIQPNETLIFDIDLLKIG
jgi:peptidylprolyl isomerase